MHIQGDVFHFPQKCSVFVNDALFSSKIMLTNTGKQWLFRVQTFGAFLVLNSSYQPIHANEFAPIHDFEYPVIQLSYSLCCIMSKPKAIRISM